MFDVLIKGGTVYDGSGRPAYTADIGVTDGCIAAIGTLTADAKEVIDASGKAVTPGFIDTHSHGDLTLPFYPEMESKVRQGITTIVGGQCGLSPAPCDKWWENQYYEQMQILELSGNLLSAPLLARPEQLSPLMQRDFGAPIDWRSYAEFLAVVEQRGIGANYLPLVGHGAIRLQVLGEDYKRTATDAEIEQMKAYLRAALDAGAAGLSSGLDYQPDIYCDFRELKALCEVVAEYGRIYDPHWRKTGLREGTPKKQKKIGGIIEALELGLQTGVQVHLAHLSVGFDVFPADDSYMAAAAAKRTPAIIDEYRQKGVRVTHDTIPNVTGGIFLEPDLAIAFLPWIKPCGSVEHFAKNLQAADYRATIAKEIYAGKHYDLNPLDNPDWANTYTILRHGDGRYNGRKIGTLADELGREHLDFVFDLLAADPYTKVFQVTQRMNESSVREFVNDPHGTIGSDTYAFDDKAIIGNGVGMPPYYPSPNTYCAFVRYLLEYPQASFEASIYKVTGLPAKIFALADRGLLEVGKRADILVIDRDALRSNEDHIEPRVYPDGIEAVLVNGVAAVRGGVPTYSRSGMVLRK